MNDTYVKYSLADNMGQGKKIPPCRYKVMHRKRVTCELHDSYFRLMTVTHAISKTAEVTHSDGQLSEEIVGVWRHVHISAWEFEGNIRPMNWTEDSEKFHCSGKLVPLLPRVHFLGHRLLTSKSPSLIDEWFYFLSWLLLLHTNVHRENKHILLYILRVVVCLARVVRNT